MPENEQRYKAYKLLRDLDSLTSLTMNQVAYGRLGGPEWKATIDAQRAAFEQWVLYAESLLECEDPKRETDSESCDPVQPDQDVQI